MNLELKYNITCYIKQGNNLISKTLLLEYDSEYHMKTAVKNYGINGIFMTENEIIIYYPPYQIEKINITPLQ